MKKLGVALWLLISLPLCFARVSRGEFQTQIQPNLNGTWKLDFEQSNFGGSKRDLEYDSLTLIISYQDPELKVARKIGRKKKERIQEIVYYTDGRGEKNPYLSKDMTIQSKTRWEGNILIMEGTTSQTFLGDVLKYNMYERWELSADGNTLIENISFSTMRSKYGTVNLGPLKAPDVRKVYRRIS